MPDKFWAWEPINSEDKTVVVIGYIDGEMTQLRVGITKRGDREVFGLYYGGTITHMCYGLDYFDIQELLSRPKHINKTRSLKYDFFYFDAGISMSEKRISMSELIRVGIALGLLPGDYLPSLPIPPGSNAFSIEKN